MRRSLYLIIVGLLLVGGCRNNRKPSETNLKNAIDRYLQSRGRACTWLGQPFPINVSAAQQKLTFGIAPQMAVLENAGLVQSVDTETNVPGIFGGATRQHVRRYEPTTDGKRYLRQTQAALTQSAGFCYGMKTVDSIVKWTEPTGDQPVSETEVTYTYKLSDLAPWAERPDIQNQFGDVRTTIGGTSKLKETITLQLTNKGWEAPGH